MESVFEIIAEPNRRSILSLLGSSEQSVGEIERQLRMSQPTVSKHLRVLERAGLISRGRDAQRRARRIDARRLAEATKWIEGYRTIWEANFSRLDDVLDELKARNKRNKRAKLKEA